MGLGFGARNRARVSAGRACSPAYLVASPRQAACSATSSLGTGTACLVGVGVRARVRVRVRVGVRVRVRVREHGMPCCRLASAGILPG